jgi:hypothetical protein
MPVYPSARGEKATERAHRPEGRNTIVTVYILGPGGAVQTAWGPDYESIAGVLSIEQALDATIDMGRTPLLWTYSVPDANYTEVKFGFDDPIGNNKIGHVALTAEATISGEIARDGIAWKINNESGAWGNMGEAQGKTNMMRAVAQFMTLHCGFQVVAARAYSSNVFKRKIQQIFR